MDRFYIIPNSAKDPELTFSNRIIAYLEKQLDHEIQFVSVGAKREQYIVKGEWV